MKRHRYIPVLVHQDTGRSVELADRWAPSYWMDYSRAVERALAGRRSLPRYLPAVARDTTNDAAGGHFTRFDAGYLPAFEYLEGATDAE